jgi:hypothetical protein
MDLLVRISHPRSGFGFIYSQFIAKKNIPVNALQEEKRVPEMKHQHRIMIDYSITIFFDSILRKVLTVSKTVKK